MTYKEFYFWLDGFVTNRHWTQYRQEEVELIIQKMKEVKEESDLGGIKEKIFQPIPIPMNPFPVNPIPSDDPFYKPYEIYCGDKTQLND